jgi:hypothetical protein
VLLRPTLLVSLRRIRALRGRRALNVGAIRWIVVRLRLRRGGLRRGYSSCQRCGYEKGQSHVLHVQSLSFQGFAQLCLRVEATRYI